MRPKTLSAIRALFSSAMVTSASFHFLGFWGFILAFGVLGAAFELRQISRGLR